MALGSDGAPKLGHVPRAEGRRIGKDHGRHQIYDAQKVSSSDKAYRIDTEKSQVLL